MPDYLEIRFDLPQLIIDSETDEPLFDEAIVYRVLLEPQITSAEL